MEHKTFPAFGTKIDADQGIVESIIAVFGNVDEGGDVLHPGSFAKSITERGRKIRVLDQHGTDSVMRVVGKPLSMREMRQEELPRELMAEYPEASGGVYAKTQFLMDTPEGKGVFTRIKEGAVTEWSFGYDPLDYDFSTIRKGDTGEEFTVRNLRTVKVYEYSPVLFGMNLATTNLSAKSKPAEGKPYDIVQEGEEYCVYRVDEEGRPMGEALGRHASEEEARQQVEAILANEGKEGKAITDEDKRVLESELRGLNMTDLVATHRRLHQFAAQGNNLTGFSQADMNWFHAAAEQELRRRAEEDERDPPEASPLEWGSGKAEDEAPEDNEEKHFPGRVAIIAARNKAKATDDGKSTEAPDEAKAGRVLAARNANRIAEAMRLLHEAMIDAGLMEPVEEDEEGKSTAPAKAADNKVSSEQDADKAGPETTPPTYATEDERLLKLIQIEIETLEV